MASHQIHYKELEQEALRGVIRTVMTRIEKIGELPGDHHFFIAFNTQADGVMLSKRLMEQYPEEMTIVLQHQFWDLKVEEDYFEVKLSFNNIPEKLVIPYKSIKVFFDPSVPYGLQLGISEIAATDKLPDMIDEKDPNTFSPPIAAFPKNNPLAENNKTSHIEENESDEPEITNKEPEKPSEQEPEEKKEQEPQKSADIVSLDTFRKK